MLSRKLDIFLPVSAFGKSLNSNCFFVSQSGLLRPPSGKSNTFFSVIFEMQSYDGQLFGVYGVVMFFYSVLDYRGVVGYCRAINSIVQKENMYNSDQESVQEAVSNQDLESELWQLGEASHAPLTLKFFDVFGLQRRLVVVSTC